MNSKPALHPFLKNVKTRLAELVEQHSGTPIEPGLTIGQIHRKLLDQRIPINDQPLSSHWFDFCRDLEDETNYPASSYSELITARPLFGQWLEEGMSPLTYFVDPAGAYTSSVIFDKLIHLKDLQLEPHFILGNLTFSEFSNALADMLSVADVGLPWMRTLGDAMPGLYEKSNWNNLIGGQFTDHAAFNEKIACKPYPGFPTLVLDRFNTNPSLYHAAEDFFYRPNTNPSLKLVPIIEQLHDIRAEVLMENVISHLYSGWSSTYADKALSEIISGYRIFTIEGHRNPLNWAVMMDYMAKKAIQVHQDSEECLWPHTLSKAFFSEINKLGNRIAHKDADSVKRHFYKTPGFLALAEGHGDSLIANASSADISNVVHSKDFLAQISAKKRKELITRNAPLVASRILKELRRNNFMVRHDEVQDFTKNIYPSMLEAVSAEMNLKTGPTDVVDKFKTRYKTVIWFQCQSLQGKKRQKKAIDYCKSLPTAELKALAAGYLDLSVNQLDPNDMEREAFLARDLGL